MAVKKNITLDSDGLAVTSGMLTVYSFDPATGEYTGAADEYLAQGVGIPAHSTDAAPPQSATGKACVFQDGSWQQVADHRGETVYSTVTGAPVLVTQPGEYPTGTTPLKPQGPQVRWNGIAWILDTKAVAILLQKEKESLIQRIYKKTQVWQTKMFLGMLSDEDRLKLVKWMLYYNEVSELDVNGKLSVEWPIEPEC
ncbi:tail fiber assembly protein [Pantoea ananatis]|uniref:tail fiber assembly protein n=1 Tax=Pantoea ananas TaxID=553 RepID=UPI00351D269B